MRWCSIVEFAGCHFDLGYFGPCGGRDGIARVLGVPIWIGKHQFAPGLPHVPFNVVGEHTQKRMSPILQRALTRVADWSSRLSTPFIRTAAGGCLSCTDASIAAFCGCGMRTVLASRVR
jgi:hypothetical protein